MELTIRVTGRPAPEGSHEIGQHNYLKHSSNYLMAWRAAVKRDAYRAYLDAGFNGAAELPLFDYPTSVYIYALTIIVGDDQCRAAGTAEPVGSPDLDKLIRATIDGLGDARVFDNDSQVVEIWNTSKRRAADGELPGAFITISDQPYRPNDTHEREEAPMEESGRYRLTLSKIMIDSDGDEVDVQMLHVEDLASIIADVWLPTISARFGSQLVAPVVNFPPLPDGPLPATEEHEPGQATKRKRRTKAEIAADNAAAAVGVNQRSDSDTPDETASSGEAAPYNPFVQPKA